MASADNTTSTVGEVFYRVTRFHWPAIQLNLCLLLITISSALILGEFVNFITIQDQLQVRIPWLFPYWITSASVSLAFVILLIYLIFNRQLLPRILGMGSFILCLLWLVGVIMTSLKLWVLNGGMNDHCQFYVNENSKTGKSVQTYAWLEQHSICQSWIVVWAFGIVGMGTFIWSIIMSYRVSRAAQSRRHPVPHTAPG